MPPRAVVVGLPRDKQLATAGRHAGGVVGAAAGQRQEAKQHEVDERQQEPFENRAGLLQREAADEGGPGGVEKRHAPGDGVGSGRDVGVEKYEDVVPRSRGQLPAGMLLAAPAGWQRFSTDEPHAAVFPRESLDDRPGAIGRIIVEDHQLEIDVAAGKDVAGEPFDRGGLVAGRHENGDAGRGRCPLWPRGTRENPQVGGGQQGRQGCQGDCDDRERADHGCCHRHTVSLPPWDTSNASPRIHAPQRRTRS